MTSIADIVDARAAATPEAVFLIDPETGRPLTYGALREGCQALRDELAACGHRPGETIAYAMHNGLDAARVILALLYGGFHATAVNLVAGTGTIAHVLSHSRAGRVLCEASTEALVRAAAPDVPRQLVEEGLFRPRPGRASGRAARPAACDDGLLMYTSGTTGVPKGVVLTHANLIAGGRNAADAHRLTAHDRGLCVLPLYHINGLCVTLLGALVSGGSLIVPARFSVSRFWDQLRTHRGTWFSVVPTQIAYLIDAARGSGRGARPDRTGLETLRFGRSASSPLSPDQQRAFEEMFAIPVIETMGLTETAAQILSNPIDGERRIGSPGVAVGNEVRVCAPDGAPCPAGTEGEIRVRGPNVMKGYLRNPQATAEALTADGWLRTGDLGRMDGDGYVTVTGRLKELIIKGGENIAPREVDEALYAHGDVIEAAAFARPCERYGQRVEAAVKLAQGSALTPDDLVALCRERVGAFKAPDIVHILPELPKGPSGKIQRARLPALL